MVQLHYTDAVLMLLNWNWSWINFAPTRVAGIGVPQVYVIDAALEAAARGKKTLMAVLNVIRYC